jgi:hypothetical protein
LERDWAVEDDVEGGALAEVYFLAARHENRGKPDSAADSGPDAGPFPATVGDATDSGAAAGENSDTTGILHLAAALFHLVFGGVHFLPGIVRID